MQNYLNDMLFKKVRPGKCRLTMDGKIAVKTAAGYRHYDPKTNTATNQANFVFDIGDDMFFTIPTTKVKTGDIILVANAEGTPTPRCVLNEQNGIISAYNYETSAIEQLVPERHVFLGKTYFYGKIVSPFAGFGTKSNDMTSMFKFMMMSRMFGKDKNTNGNTRYDSDDNGMFGGMFSGMQDMLPMMMLMNGGGEMGGLFDNILGEISFDNTEDANEATPATPATPVTPVTPAAADTNAQ